MKKTTFKNPPDIEEHTHHNARECSPGHLHATKNVHAKNQAASASILCKDFGQRKYCDVLKYVCTNRMTTPAIRPSGKKTVLIKTHLCKHFMHTCVCVQVHTLNVNTDL